MPQVKYDCGSCERVKTGLIDFKAHVLKEHTDEYDTIEDAVNDSRVFKDEVDEDE